MMLVNEFDWSVLAPKREDWDRLSKAWANAGLGNIPWRNGLPVFPDGVDLARVQEIINGAGDRVASPQKKPVAPPVTPAPVQSFFKRGRGRPKKK